MNITVMVAELIGQQWKVTQRMNSDFERVPAVGEHILLNFFGKRGVYHIDHVVNEPGSATRIVVSPHDSLPFTVSETLNIRDIGVPSLVSFDGQTIGDLVAFLQKYPLDQRVAFRDDQKLVAKAKHNMIILRLDDRAD